MGWRWKGEISWSGDIAGQEADEEMRITSEGFGSDGKKSACNAGDLGSILGSGRSPGEGMAAYSNILAWRTPWKEKPEGLQSMGLQRVRHN